MIQNIVFDMGGVLITWSPHRIAARFDLCDGDMQLLRREVFGSVEWVCLDRGSLSEQEALQRFRARLPEGLHPAAERCVFWWKEELWPIEGMEELIRELADMGYGIYLLSNASRAQHTYWPEFAISRRFDGRLISADVGVIKPMPEIYRLFTEKFSLQPGECVFVDDMTANVAAAVHEGWKGIVFHGDAAELEVKLSEMGVRTDGLKKPGFAD